MVGLASVLAWPTVDTFLFPSLTDPPSSTLLLGGIALGIPAAYLWAVSFGLPMWGWLDRGEPNLRRHLIWGATGGLLAAVVMVIFVRGYEDIGALALGTGSGVLFGLVTFVVRFGIAYGFSPRRLAGDRESKRTGSKSEGG